MNDDQAADKGASRHPDNGDLAAAGNACRRLCERTKVRVEGVRTKSTWEIYLAKQSGGLKKLKDENPTLGSGLVFNTHVGKNITGYKLGHIDGRINSVRIPFIVSPCIHCCSY